MSANGCFQDLPPSNHVLTQKAALTALYLHVHCTHSYLHDDDHVFVNLVCENCDIRAVCTPAMFLAKSRKDNRNTK